MLRHIRPAVSLLALLTLVTGLAYPLAVTGVASLVFPAQAGGGLILRDGKTIGSALIGQNFVDPRYFHGRPSATTAPDPADAAKSIDAPYNAAGSGGANLGPTSAKLIQRIKADADALKAVGAATPLPADALTTSASGLDPHISPANARMQAAAVARARGLPAEKVAALVAAQTEGPILGLIGESRVNVLALNLALDALK
ncbi:MAG: potassium-transporting ATPase subunit KdpC [Rhizobiales bacterium]|nr:potassium-transporting ATPase subunit KdpC [Hyphomicrobiales bacterium]